MLLSVHVNLSSFLSIREINISFENIHYFRYFCTGGSETSTPSNGRYGGLCPPGHYCPSGSVNPLSCPPGTYVLQNGAIECNICPAGKYCLPGTPPNLCPSGKCSENTVCSYFSDVTGTWCHSYYLLLLVCAGFFCPQGTGLDWMACPPGTYSSKLGLESVAGCKLCDPGKYCMFRNATMVSGDCYAGFYCTAGSRLPDSELELPGNFILK